MGTVEGISGGNEGALARSPWAPISLLLLASTAVVVGTIWDVSWDASFGRDSLWSPPHMMFNGGVALAVVAALWAAVAATRAGMPAGIALGSVRLPLGSAVVVWGGGAVLAATVLDGWWSSAYGLLATAWSPPQVLLITGVAALLVGGLLSGAWSDNNRRRAAATPGAPVAAPLPTGREWGAGLLLTFAATTIAEYSLPNLQRTALFYQLSALVYPFVLLTAATAVRRRWSATRAAAMYMLIVCVLVWLLPLFAAKPLVGPVYHEIDSLLPPRFPLLLALPAVAIDLLVGAGRRGAWTASALCGLAFVVLFTAAQWTFAAFLLSPAADNRFFAGGAGHWPFYMQVGAEGGEFWGLEQSPVGAETFLFCAAEAVLGSRLGIWLGSWIAQVRR